MLDGILAGSDVPPTNIVFFLDDFIGGLSMLVVEGFLRVEIAFIYFLMLAVLQLLSFQLLGRIAYFLEQGAEIASSLPIDIFYFVNNFVDYLFLGFVDFP